MRIEIPLHEIEFTFARGSGKGGQKRNKTSSRAILDFDVRESLSLTEDQKAIVLNDSSRVTADGHIIIANDDTRYQHRNKKAAHEILNEHLSKLLTPRKKRKPKKKSAGVKAREKESRKHHQRKKAERKVRYE